MVTTPSDSSQAAPHTRPDIGQSFGSDARRYDRSRPHYPHQLAEAILAGLPGHRVLDVGIGTGISALPFRAAGAEIRGLEADVRMAELSRSRGFEVDVARFEDWDGHGEQFDAVVAGQTWHWIDPVLGARTAAQLLRPGGRLAVFWNVGEPDAEIAAAFGAVYRSVPTGLPFTPWAGEVSAVVGYERGILARADDGIRASGEFTDPGRLRFDWQTTLSRDEWLDQVPTSGGHDRIPADRLAELLDGLGAVVDAHGGRFTMRYATVAVTADRLPSR